MDTRNLLPPRWWWLVLLVIVVGAGALRFTGYNFSLPYIDHPDEPNFNIAAQMIIDMGTSKSMHYQGYPPGIVTLNYLFLHFFHDPTTPPGTIIWMIRLLAIATSLALMLVIGLLAVLLATPLAGLLAAALWGFNPVAIEFSRYATADIFVAFFTVLAVYLVLAGVVYRREGWVTAGIVANLVGILFKYQSGFVLPLLLLLSLAPLRTPGADRRRILEAFIRRMLIIGTFAFWLFLIYPSLEANQIPNWVAPTDRMGLPSVEQLWSQVSILIATHTWGLPLLLLALGGVLLKRDFLRRLAVVGAAFLLWVGGVGLFGAADIRQLIGALAFLMVFLGVGFAAWAEILMRARLSRVASSGLVAAAVLILLVPDLSLALADAYNRTLPDRRNDLAQWMDVSVPPGAYIAPIENEKTFNREWGGYPGFNVFPHAATAALTEQPLDEWRARGVMYAIIPYGDYPLLDPDLLSQLLVLKSYPPSPDYRGPDMVVLRLYPMQHTTDGQLGAIHWIGYDMGETEVTPADTLQFTLYWQAEQPTSGDYAVYNHLVDAQTGDVVAQVDGDPLFDLRRPTSMWDDPNETLISRQFTLPLSDVPPGTYQLVSGFYRRDTGERLLSPQGEDGLVIATIEVR